MREILFRGRRTDNGEWEYGVFIPDCLESLHGQDCHWGFIKTYRLEGKCENVKNETVEVDRETVGQYIGLTDKNGKKIFEGDIVEEGDKIGVVKFGEGTFDSGFYRYMGFYYEEENGKIDQNSIYDIDEYWEKIEVIGNIYDKESDNGD